MLHVLHFYKEGPFFTNLPTDTIFVVGTNLRGRHGAGAARMAAQYYGLKEGRSEGLCGQSYAIPTRDHQIKTLPVETIAQTVHRFLVFARGKPNLKFIVTPVGTGHAGLEHNVIAPMFAALPENCAVSELWLPFIPHVQAFDCGL